MPCVPLGHSVLHVSRIALRLQFRRQSATQPSNATTTWAPARRSLSADAVEQLNQHFVELTIW
jgi:hypothetical protein